MARKLQWCLFFIHFWIIFVSSGEDIKNIDFLLYWNSGGKLECKGNNLKVLVGDQFKIKLFYIAVDTVHNIGRCYKSQKNDFVNTAFWNSKFKVYTSNDNITVTRAEDWKYVCIFYTFFCKGFKNNLCQYSYWMYEDPGINCKVTIHVEDVVIPSGYLIAGTTNFTPSIEDHIYKFHNGESINFTCSKTTGRSVNISYIETGEQNMNDTQRESATIYKTMGPENDNTTLSCTIIGDKTQQVIRLKLILDSDKLGFWIIVLGAAFIVLLLSVGLCIVIRQKRKQIRKNDLPVVSYQNLSNESITIPVPKLDDATYAETYSNSNPYNNIPINIKEDSLEEHTYINSQELNNELTYASIKDNDRGYATVCNNERDNTTKINNKPMYAVKDKENSNTAVKSKEISAELKTNLKLARLSAVEHDNEDVIGENNSERNFPPVKKKKPKLAEMIALYNIGANTVKTSEGAPVKVKNRPKPASIKKEPNFASVKPINLNFATLKNSELDLESMNDNKQQHDIAIERPDPTYVNQNSIRKKNFKKLKVKIRGSKDKTLSGDAKNTKTSNKTSDDGKKRKGASSREKKEDSSNSDNACKMNRKDKKLGITYAELSLENANFNKLKVSKVTSYSQIKIKDVKTHGYENVIAENYIEPAYCEISKE